MIRPYLRGFRNLRHWRRHSLSLHYAHIMQTWQTTIATTLKQPYKLELIRSVIPRATFCIPFEDHTLPASKGGSLFLVVMDEAIASRQASKRYSFPYCTFVLS